MSVTTTITLTVSRSILGPLLTTFTPPSECFQYGSPPYTIGRAFQGQGCFNGIVHDTSTCWPSASFLPPAGAFNGWGFYSPGTICPSGYTRACAGRFNYNGPPATSDSIPSFNFQYPLIAGESAVGCCPSGFTCQGNEIQTCASYITSGSYEVGYCATGGPSIAALTSFQPVEVPETSVFTMMSPQTTLSETVMTATLFAPLFQMNWQASDLSVTSTSTSSSATDSTPTPPLVPAPVPSASGLSTGAKAAIGVVIPVAVLAILGVLGFWLLRWRRRNNVIAAQPTLMPKTTESTELQPPRPPSRSRELEAETSPRELEEDWTRLELVGDRHYSHGARELGT